MRNGRFRESVWCTWCGITCLVSLLSDLSIFQLLLIDVLDMLAWSLVCSRDAWQEQVCKRSIRLVHSRFFITTRLIFWRITRSGRQFWRRSRFWWLWSLILRNPQVLTSFPNRTWSYQANWMTLVDGCGCWNIAIVLIVIWLSVPHSRLHWRYICTSLVEGSSCLLNCRKLLGRLSWLIYFIDRTGGVFSCMSLLLIIYVDLLIMLGPIVKLLRQLLL